MHGHEVHRWQARLEDGAGPGAGHAFVGDPSSPRTYGTIQTAGREVVAVVDLPGRSDASAVVQALQASHPDAQVLVVSPGGRASGTGEVRTQRVAWADLLRLDLDTALQRLAAQRCVEELRAFAADASTIPIVLQDDPDPDGIASALAIRTLLYRGASTAPIVSLGRVTRPENRRMTHSLGVEVVQVSRAELRGFERIVAVDVQPHALDGARTRIAIIDHHPVEAGPRAEFADIRAHYGATATILTEYLRVDDERRISRRLATALLYGIQTDTALLTRGVTAADVTAYAFLQERADATLLRRIARPVYPEPVLRAFGRALSGMHVNGDVVVMHLGTVRPADAHVLADLADLALSLDKTRWAAVAAVIRDDLVIALRHLGPGLGAGVLAKHLAGTDGIGGGHTTMARANLPGPVARDRLGHEAAVHSAEAVSRLVCDAIRRMGE